ncbi:hypothetical protein, partial [Nocardioides sp. J54]|uniref:hypothetical protein n=1 Tax=Nocardioides sp. J54 TaxID=935866 RepID=UPI000491CB32
MSTYRTLTGDLRDVARTAEADVTATVRTNQGNRAIVDRDTGRVFLPGTSHIDVRSNGTFRVELLDSHSPDTNVDGPIQYAIDVRHAGKPWTSGWFELTADTDLADVVAVDFIPATLLDGVDAALAGELAKPDSESGAAVDTRAAAVATSAAVVAAEAAVAPLATAVDDLAADTLPDADGWPIHLYGASYAVVNQTAGPFFTPGGHYAQLLAAKAAAGAVTSYGVNGRRALDVALTLLNGQPMSGITGIIAAGKWPGTATRSGLLVHDALGNDVMNQAAMNAASITVAAITGSA